jgi:predicted MPP superfamily phosphohydrolase
MEYDIIGDIHGHARELECLLDKLGYSTDGKLYPQGRQLLFLGDFIDRGPENRRTIEIVQKLVLLGLASAVMGNHEYNAICYHTRSQVGDKEFLRDHSEKNTGQHQAFLNDYPDKKEREQVIRWFQTGPVNNFV